MTLIYWSLYLLAGIFFSWLFFRFVIWQLQRFIRKRFNVDITIASVGLLAAYLIKIRVNELQSLEIDKVFLKIQFKSRHFVTLNFGEIRIHGERSISFSNTEEKKIKSPTKKYRFLRLLEKIEKHLSIRVESLNLMLLNAPVKESLLHLTLSKVHLYGGCKSVAEDKQAVVMPIKRSSSGKILQNNFTSVSKSKASFGLAITIGEVRGKILKSRQQHSESSTCIAEINTCFDFRVLATQFYPKVCLDYCSLTVDRMKTMLHTGAIIPGVLLPSEKPPTFIPKQDRSSLTDSGIFEVVELMANASVAQVNDFSVLLISDGGAAMEKIFTFSVSSTSLMQRKNEDAVIDASTKVGDAVVQQIIIPTGSLHLEVEDVCLVDSLKRDVVAISRIVLENKLKKNHVLSMSLDITLCHSHYYHEEIAYWIHLIHRRLLLLKASSPLDNKDGEIRNALREAALIRESRSTQSSFNSSLTTCHKRTQSAPYQYHSSGLNQDLCNGKIYFPRSVFDAVNVLNILGITTVWEFSMYDAVMYIHTSSIVECDVSPFEFGVDCLTTSIDHSANSSDINFMAKVDCLWCKASLSDTANKVEDHNRLLDNRQTSTASKHEWGRAFNLEALRLHGQVNIVDGSFIKQQRLSASLDLRASGVQIEISQVACVSIMQLLTAWRGIAVDMQSRLEIQANQKMKPLNTRKFASKYDVDWTFVEVNISQINIFFLAVDEACDCVVARLDDLKVDSKLFHVVEINGLAVSQIHNPHYSAFAKYESASRSPGASSFYTRHIPADIRKKQREIAVYTCMSAALMKHNIVAVEHIVLKYNNKGKHDVSLHLQNSEDILFKWSPTLHILLHSEITTILDKVTQIKMSANSKRNWMCGDQTVKSDTKRKWTLSLQSRCRICTSFELAENMSVQICCDPISIVNPEGRTEVNFNKLQLFFDGHEVFRLTSCAVTLREHHEQMQRDRKTFSELETSTNRVWQFDVDNVNVFFPFQYNFARTFDQLITTFKWVKAFYRKTSSPFRSLKLPPDLLIRVGKFTFEIEDWEFESRLRDNHELMKDEWIESEKRRKILDKRVADLRREKGELLPAKKLKELYMQLDDAHMNIYLNRSKKMYHHFSRSILFTWTVSKVEASVIADASMHGMKNATETIKRIDPESPFPKMTGDGPDDSNYTFVTLWCRCVRVHFTRFQCLIRNYPQYLMDVHDWTIWGKFCAAEQKGSDNAQRIEYVPLPSPWSRQAVKRNMPALKFYHDLSSDVQTWHMAWGPCWDPAWSQVNLATNLISKTSLDPSEPLPWWDKSRIIFHGRWNMSMNRTSMLHLASLDPYNTTEHAHWDWKKLYLDWTNCNFLFKGDLDIHIRTASKYDDIRFLHLPNLRMEWAIKWITKEGRDPNNHHMVEPCAPDKATTDGKHDSYEYFRSRNVDLLISLDVKQPASANPSAVPEALFYSTTLRWMTNFGTAINAVTRPVCKGTLFQNHCLPKLKLSRHYNNVQLSLSFPQLKVQYWSSYAQQLGIMWKVGQGQLSMQFQLTLVKHVGTLKRRSQGNWSIVSALCDINNAKVYFLKNELSEKHRSSASSDDESALDRNFLMSFSKMNYQLEENKETKENTKLTKSTNNNRHHLAVCELRAMWTTDNRDVGFGIYEAYNKAAILKHNLSTKVLKNIRMKSQKKQSTEDEAVPDDLSSDDVFHGSLMKSAANRKSTGSLVDSADTLLRQLLNENTRVVTENLTSDQQQLKGILACQHDDVLMQTWKIKLTNCQVMLKGPKTQGYMILTASEGEFANREHSTAWRDGQLTSKTSWIGSLNDMQFFATVERDPNLSDKDGEKVPWLMAVDIEPRGPSPGMLNISDLMNSGQSIGGVVGDGVSAGSFQLQRIMSRCSCRMFYTGYESLVDSGQVDYGGLLSATPEQGGSHARNMSASANFPKLDSSDLLGKEKPINTLTVFQPDLEICTNASQFTMIIDIVENLLLYLEPGMKSYWERIDRMRFRLQLTTFDDVARHRETLTQLQEEVRLRLNKIRTLEKELYRVQRSLDHDSNNLDLYSQSFELQRELVAEKETINEQSEELGIIIRCFKELYLQHKTKVQVKQAAGQYEDEASVARRTEVSMAQVKWNLTDADGQLTIAHFELKNFLYEKINRSNDSVEHLFELGWLCLQNLIPNSLYRDVLMPQNQQMRSHNIATGGHSRQIALRVLCKVRPPVGGISVKEHVEVNAVPMRIQLTYQFFARMMSFFFPGKGFEDQDVDRHGMDAANASLLGISTHIDNSRLGVDSSQRKKSSATLPPPSPSPSNRSPLSESTTTLMMRKPSSVKQESHRAIDDVDKMKLRAAKNQTFLYIKVPQVPLCVSYKGEKEKNIEDVRDFHILVPMLLYHNRTWTWHDFAMAVKRDCKKTLISQMIKEKLSLGKSRSSNQTTIADVSNLPTNLSPASEGTAKSKQEDTKARLLLGTTSLKRADSHRKSLFRKKKH